MPVLFFVLWIILNGRITLELVVLGILISAGVTYFAYKTAGYIPENDLRIIRNFPLFVVYTLNLLLEIVKAAVIVLGTIYRADEPEPVFIEFHSGLQGTFPNVLLASSITLTPGTITVFQEGDHFLIHCLHPEYAEGIEDSSFIRLLRKMK